MTRAPLPFLVKIFFYLHRLVEEQSRNKRTIKFIIIIIFIMNRCVYASVYTMDI